MTWNPNTDCVLGIEWFPKIERTRKLDGRNIVAAGLVSSTSAETIEQIRLGTLDSYGDAGEQTGYELEIYEAGNLPSPGATSEVEFFPGNDVGNFQMFGWDSSTSPSISPPTQTGLWEFLDDTSFSLATFPSGVTVHDSNMIFPTFGRQAAASFGLAGIAGILTGKLITYLDLKFWAASYTDLGAVSNASFRSFLGLDGQRFYGSTETIGPSGAAFVRRSEFRWDANPSVGCSWKVPEIDDFDSSGGSSTVGIVIEPTGSSNNLAALLALKAVVGYQDVDDHREAYGCLADPEENVRTGWTTFELFQPDGTPGWAKANATDYVFVIRRRTGRGFLQVRSLEADKVPPHVWTPIEVALYNTTNRVFGYEESGVGVPSMLLETSSATSEDSLGYMSVDGDGGGQISLREWTKVNTAQSLIQELTPSVTDSFSWMRVLVRMEAYNTEETLTLRVKRRSDDVQFGGDVTVTPSDLEPPKFGPGAWQDIGDVINPAASLVSGTQYYVEATCPAAEGLGWEVQVVSSLPLDWPQGAPPADVGDVLFGDGVDEVEIDSVEYSTMTVCATLHTQEDPPANFSAAGQELTDCINFIRLSWDATNLVDCGGFLRYEIERFDTRDQVWQRIADITTQSVEEMDDHELRRNVDTTYRLRVVRADGAPSDWSTLSPIQATMGCCGYIFTSNLIPDLSVWYDEHVEGIRPFTPIEEVTVQRFSGRKFSVGFHSLDDGGWSLDTTLMIAADNGIAPVTPTTTPGLRAWDNILNMVRPSRGALLPYVTLLNQDGDRLFATVQTSNAEREETGGIYRLDLTATQVTDVPYAIDIEGS